MMSKGRNASGIQSGEKNGKSKLTAEQVREIRAKHAVGITQTAIAKEYGLSQSNVHLIVKNKTWPITTPTEA